MRTLMVSALAGVASCMLSLSAAGLLVDQTVNSFLPNGGLGTPVVQSFTPGVDSIAAVDVYVGGTAALENDLTVSVFDTYSTQDGLSGLVIEGVKENVPRGQVHRVVFDTPASITPGEEYYLRFLFSNSGDEEGGFSGLLAIGSRSDEQYPGGEVLVGGGNLNNAADALFATLYVPEPSALGLLACGGVLLLGRRRSAPS